MTPALAPLLEVRDLQTTFTLGRSARIKAVDGVSFSRRERLLNHARM